MIASNIQWRYRCTLCDSTFETESMALGCAADCMEDDIRDAVVEFEYCVKCKKDAEYCECDEEVVEARKLEEARQHPDQKKLGEF